MSNIGENKNRVKQFESEIATTIGVEMEEFNNSVQRFKDREFPFSNSPSLEIAMKEMGITEEQSRIEVSLDTGEITAVAALGRYNSSVGQVVSSQEFSRFSNNVGATLQAHGGLAEQYAHSEREDNLQEFGQKAAKMGRSIEQLSDISGNEQIEVIATMGAGTSTLYGKLESSATESKDAKHIVKLGRKLYEYIVAQPESEDKRTSALLDNNIATINAIKDAYNPALNSVKHKLEHEVQQVVGDVTKASNQVKTPQHHHIVPGKKNSQHSR
jgi:hypothetical protein